MDLRLLGVYEYSGVCQDTYDSHLMIFSELLK